jgi:hypothetical protein
VLQLIGAAKVCTVWGFTSVREFCSFPSATFSTTFSPKFTATPGAKSSVGGIWRHHIRVVHELGRGDAATAEGWNDQQAYNAVFGQTPRIVFASLTAFFVGEFANSYVLAKMKVKTSGRHLWARTIGSTIVGEGVDSLVFYPVAFLGCGAISWYFRSC